MTERDETARHNLEYWKRQVETDCEYSRPWLDLDRDLLERFVSGKVEIMPAPYGYLYPRSVFQNVAGKDVLCLASGGGQQSAAFGLLGARVTVLDLTDEQLEMDRRTAAHHGYEIRTIAGDMRDLTTLDDDSFDLVYQAISICFVPDTREVYSEVAGILRPGGLYRVGHVNPATYGMEEETWDGVGYRIMEPNYHGRVERADAMEYRHSLSDIFTGLAERGFHILSVDDDPRHLTVDPDATPGTWEHLRWWVLAYFAIVAQWRPDFQSDRTSLD